MLFIHPYKTEFFSVYMDVYLKKDDNQRTERLYIQKQLQTNWIY